jgi:hypothetical protein
VTALKISRTSSRYHGALRVKRFLINLDGYLYTNNSPIEGAREALKLLGLAGISYRHVTNATHKLRQEVAAHLKASGLPAEEGKTRCPLSSRRSSSGTKKRAASLWSKHSCWQTCYPGDLAASREYLRHKVKTYSVGTEDLLPLFDPQASGGLLVVVPYERSAAFCPRLEETRYTGTNGRLGRRGPLGACKLNAPRK